MSTPRFALCLFLPDPPRGPVPECRVLATGVSARALLPAVEAAQQLLTLPSTVMNLTITAIGFVDQHTVPPESLVLKVLPLDEAVSRSAAHHFAGWCEYQDSCALMGIRRTA